MGEKIFPSAKDSARARDKATLKSAMAQASKPINPITLKRFSWQDEEEKKS